MSTAESSLTNPERTQSMFRIFSLATVASNKERNSEYIEATPHEQLPMLNGELTQAQNEYKASASDANGVTYEENTVITASVKAKWKCIGSSNRMTPPDVRRGEEVILYQFADSDEYFWDTANNHIGIRKLETVVYAFSGTTDETDNEPSPDNSYVFEISTHDGYIKMTTSNANGEPYKYEALLDTKNGSFHFKDNTENMIMLNSKEKHWRIQNADGTFIELKGKEINMSSSKSINSKTDKNNLKASNNNVTAETMHKGNTTHAGNMGVAGDISMSAGDSGSGDGTFSGTLRVTGDVIASGISLINHRHPGDSGGTTGKPL